MSSATRQVLEAAHEAESGLARGRSPALARPVADARAQFGALIYPGFVSETGLARLPDLVRYLRAISRGWTRRRRTRPATRSGWRPCTG